MNTINPDQFDSFFEELHGHTPYSWQRRLAEDAIAGKWPGAIDLPTGSGKTACIDIAVFALACQASLPVAQRTAPRRVFFCVNRRVIVDEAYQRARKIAGLMRDVEQGRVNNKPVLRGVAAALRSVAGTCPDDDVPPLDVLELRGGIYRDNRWARSITQPTIVCTTLDQLGSRLLFRGYGVSLGAAPIQAALIAYDSLILLDEAHISEPFRQTLDHVRRYLDPQKWAEQSIGISPVTVVPMTATPNDEMRNRGVVQLDEQDRQNESLSKRLAAAKPAKLTQSSNIAKDAVEAALHLVKKSPTAVGIIVNRVATARAIYDKLREKHLDALIELVIGSMRPIDRDKQSDRLRNIVGPDRTKPQSTQTSFIVATQCLEVGADYDFDVLITECASLDALRQRFGRLNRGGRSIDAEAVILIGTKDAKPEDKLDDAKPIDPIYGNALARTWNWLNEQGTEEAINDKPVKRIDFGIDAFDNLLKKHSDDGRPPKELLAPSASLNAPVMLPAYVDFWCQTAPQPVPDPDVSLFIHGPQRSEPDVQVCWRADIGDSEQHPKHDQWCDVVALLPPTSAECMSVPISRLRRWLGDQIDDADDHGDLLGISEQNDQGKGDNGDQRPSLKHPGVLWRGMTESKLVEMPNDLRPGDTLVLPATTPDSHLLGHLPMRSATDETPADGSEVDDVAEPAFIRALDRAALRLHPALRSSLPSGSAIDALFAAANATDESPSRADWPDLLKTAAASIDDADDLRKQTLQQLVDKGFRIEQYPDGRGVVITTRKRLGSATDWFMPSLDDGEDDASRTTRKQAVLLDDHTSHVCEKLSASLQCLPMLDSAAPFSTAAELHDLGKADERFQSMLRRTDRTDAWLLAGVTSALLAKSDGLPQTRRQRADACDRAGLPRGFRHEMLSVQLAELSGKLPTDAQARDLVLHLIAAHHGHARPFAPVVPDDELPALEVKSIVLPHEQRAELIPAHRLDSGIAERFWSLTRRFGWWGLAYLEAILRLADQQASAAEDTGTYRSQHVNEPAEAAT